MRVTVAQLNPVVGAIDENVGRIIDVIETAARDGAALAVFSELVVTGYPPKDLLERPAFVDQARAGLDRIATASGQHPHLGIVVGCPVYTGLDEGKALYNAVFLVSGGKVRFEQPKMLLPMYDVFDEARYFMPGMDNRVCPFNGAKLGLSVCEDLWFEPEHWKRHLYAVDPIDRLAKQGASFLINISASPFSVGKDRVRHDLIRNHAKKHRVPFLFVNQVGGNDDLVFDGRSMYVDESGHARHVFPSFEEAVRTIDTDEKGRTGAYPFESDVETIFKALVLGTRDYVRKCGLSQVIVGLSGGIDSAVTAVIACHAVGAEHVVVLAMPSPYTSDESMEDARLLARNLGVKLETIPITDLMKAYEEALKGVFSSAQPDVTEENIQARIRGNLLMAYSNKFGHLPLSTGNKSELAVGYCTLYGDMSGGLAVISDVPKTDVYRVARLINGKKTIIPKRIIEKPPSAELKPGQFDQDVLPPYEVLDGILECYIDQHCAFEEIVRKGFDRSVVSWVIETVRKNEYKRKQAAPGLKVTSKAFGSGRRVPIASDYDV
jgi:NAD+ synthase (glutamine-hydrolysing)